MTHSKETLSEKLANYELERPKGSDVDSCIFSKLSISGYFEDCQESNIDLTPIKPNLGEAIMEAIAKALEIDRKDKRTETNKVIQVTDSNIKYVVTLLQPWDVVSYRVCTPHNPDGDLHDALVLREVVWDLDQEPMLRTYLNKHGSFHSSHLVEVKLMGPRLKVKSYVYQPTGFLCNFYSDTSEVVNVLKNKYGHRPNWKRTLYDVGGISQYLFDNKIKKSKRKAVILRMAPHSKLNIASVIKENRNEAAAYYNDDQQLDYFDL